MMYFKVKIIGYHSTGYGSTDAVLVIQAENENEATSKGKNWCNDNSSMGGSEWYLNSSFSVATEEEYNKAKFKA